MRRTEQEWREARWRVKGTGGLILLFAWIGAALWLWRSGLEEMDLPRLIELVVESGGDQRFWLVMALCAALGGWLAFVLFWRGQYHDGPQEQGPGGMSGPSF